MLQSAKFIIKRLAYRSGLAGLYHRIRNRRTLTVAMFHRVLPPQDPRFAGANPKYTVSSGEFEQLLLFFAAHYNIVSLADVEAAYHGERTLPARAMLISFDDGWRDNLEYALPLLKRRRCPAVLFVATGHVGNAKGFWQEELYDAVVSGRLAAGALRALCNVDASDTDRPEDTAHLLNLLTAALEKMPADQREQKLSDFVPPAPGRPRAMIGAAEFDSLLHGAMAIGGHGHTHEPLTTVPDPDGELRQCRSTLQQLVPAIDRPAFSFPHGRYDDRLIALVAAANFGLCFTSDPALTDLGRLSSGQPLGRQEIDLSSYRDGCGKGDHDLDIAGLAFNLFTQRIG